MNIIKGWKIFLHGNNWSQNLPTHPTHLPLLLHPTLDHPLLHLHPFMGSGHMILQIIMMFVRLPTDVTNFLALVRRGMVCPQMTALFVRFTTDFTRVWTLTCMNSGMYFQLEALYKTLTTNVTPKYLYFYSISPTKLIFNKILFIKKKKNIPISKLILLLIDPQKIQTCSCKDETKFL